MLQRIQSIYLLFAGLVIFALYFFPLAHNVYIDGKPTTVKVTGLYQDVNGVQTQTQSFIALTAATAVMALIPIAIIFLYKNRKQQVNLCYGAIVALIGYSFWVSQTVKNISGGFIMNTNNFGIGIFLSSLSIVLIIMAFKAVQRDEKLVKSADRLR